MGGIQRQLINLVSKINKKNMTHTLYHFMRVAY